MSTIEGNNRRTVVIPLDSSSTTEHAFRWYQENIMRPGDKVVFVHVVEPLHETHSFLINLAEAFTIPDMGKDLCNNIAVGKGICAKYLAQMQGQTDIQTEAILHMGVRPGRSILETAEQHKADTIIIGSHGLGAVKRTFLGSVSDYVIHHAGIPVTVVPHPD